MRNKENNFPIGTLILRTDNNKAKPTLTWLFSLLTKELEFRELDVSPGKTEVKQGKFVEFISPAKGYFRETSQSQNLNPISPTSKFTLGIMQIIVKCLSASFQCLVKKKKINISVQFQYLAFQPHPEVRGVCMEKFFASMLVYTSFPLI